jgi:hypothetical protein
LPRAELGKGDTAGTKNLKTNPCVLPKFYSKAAIGITTNFLSPFFGAILFAYNLREVGKAKVAPFIVLIGMFWMLLFKKLTEGFLESGLLQLLIGNVMGSAILIFPLWNQFFLHYPAFQKKNVWKPLLIFVAICIALILFQILAFNGGR